MLSSRRFRACLDALLLSTAAVAAFMAAPAAFADTSAPPPPTASSVSRADQPDGPATNVTPRLPFPAPPAKPAPAAERQPIFAPARLLGLPNPAHGWIVDGNLDIRYREASSGRTEAVYLNEAELDVGHPIYTHNQYLGNVFAQLIGENTPDASGAHGRYNEFALGEAYLTYHLPFQTQTGSSAYLQVGQFVLHVGLLPVYDTHLQILQPLAAYGVGERNDFGVELVGRFNGIIDYRFALTSGTGVDHVYINPTRVVSFRLGRLFATPYGVVNFGGSLLSGRLPVTEVDPITGFAPILPPSGKISATFGYVTKTRVAGDATYNYRGLTARGEVMTGADDNTTVNGYFLEGEYRFAPGLSALVSRSYWNYGHDDSTSSDDAAGIDLAYGNNLVIRALYEERRDVPYLLQGQTGPLAPTHLRHIFTVQSLLRF